ncbi:MAG: hypothetical protein QM802_12290 [Agriterribacter sp.]
MKVNIFIAVIFSITMLMDATAQSTSKKSTPVFSTSNIENGYVKARGLRLSANGEKVYLNSINSNAVIDFKNRCEGVDDETWQQHADGKLTATCKKDNTNYIIHYSKKGKWEGTLKGYSEDKMPFEVRDLVKRNYYDFTIKYVEEIETLNSNGKPTYMVHISFKDDAKIIRVRDGEMDTWFEIKTQ